MAICFILQLHVLSEYGANTERIRSGHITQKYRLSKSLISDIKKYLYIFRFVLNGCLFILVPKK